MPRQPRRPMTRTYALDARSSSTRDEVRALIGGKAANLAAMLGPDLRLPVPPGFAITTATCREVLAAGWPDGPRRRAPGADGRGRGGDAAAGSATRPTRCWSASAPGAPVSMPGMMDTILNLGLTPATTEGLARGHRRPGVRRRLPRPARRRCSRRSSASSPCPTTRGSSCGWPIEAVFRSWNSDRATAYRRREGIPDDLGTAVTVQAMVFGNRGADSATGVAFTRNPATGEPVLYGDVLFDAQGEDVVAGTHRTEPIAVLDERLPEAGPLAARGRAPGSSTTYGDLCDIEFTIEQGRLWLLQVRAGKRSPQAALRIAVDMANDPSFPLTRARGGRTRRPAARRSADGHDRPQRLRAAAGHRARGVARRRERRDRDVARRGGARPPRPAGA